MYLANLLALVVDTMRRTFDEDYPVEQFRGLWVSVEYPIARTSYPGIWVDYQPTTDIQAAGIVAVEYTEPALDGTVRSLTRWRYAGMITLTCVALTSLERARLVDEVVKVVAFGTENAARSEFVHGVEHNDLIACQIQRDRMNISTKAENMGTPWATDEILYEQTVTLDCQGEFLSDGSDGTLVPLSAVRPYPIGPGDEPPSGDGWI